MIKSELPNSFEDVKALVKDGVITLEGDVTSDHQRERLEWAMVRVRGAKRINSLLVLKPTPPPTEIKREIEQAFRRIAESRACRLGRAWCDQGRQPTHHRPVKRLPSQPT
jgi:hypothetical protein